MPKIHDALVGAFVTMMTTHATVTRLRPSGEKTDKVPKTRPNLFFVYLSGANWIGFHWNEKKIVIELKCNRGVSAFSSGISGPRPGTLKLAIFGPEELLCARCLVGSANLGFFLKEISAIVRAICRRAGDLTTRIVIPPLVPRQRLLCSGASVSD